MSDEEEEYEDVEEESELESEEEEEVEHVDTYCVEDVEYEEPAEIEKVLSQPNYVETMHPEEKMIPYEEVLALCTVERNANGNIVDPYHKTIPFLSKYEFTRILGLRATQIEQGGQIFIETDSIDPYLIAKEELRQKKIPFIIKRPIPGSMEYWKVSDLELLE